MEKTLSIPSVFAHVLSNSHFLFVKRFSLPPPRKSLSPSQCLSFYVLQKIIENFYLKKVRVLPLLSGPFYSGIDLIPSSNFLIEHDRVGVGSTMDGTWLGSLSPSPSVASCSIVTPCSLEYSANKTLDNNINFLNTLHAFK